MWTFDQLFYRLNRECAIDYCQSDLKKVYQNSFIRWKDINAKLASMVLVSSSFLRVYREYLSKPNHKYPRLEFIHGFTLQKKTYIELDIGWTYPDMIYPELCHIHKNLINMVHLFHRLLMSIERHRGLDRKITI